MENAYGIGVKNRYELFYDEDVDPLEIIRQQEEEKEKRKLNPKEKTKNPKPGKVLPATGLSKKSKESPIVNPPKPSESTETSNKSRSRPFTERTARNPRNLDESKALEERKNFRNREDHGPPNSDNRERDSEMRRGRGGFRGRGRGGRGRGGFFNSFENRPPRRDPHSGSYRTGLRSVDKRDGAESNVWEDVKSDPSTRKKESDSTWADEEFDSSGLKQNDSNWGDIERPNLPSQIKDEATDEKPDALNCDSKESLPAAEDHNEETGKEMTLDEWKREQEAKRAVPKYNLRKPGEGEDGNQWKRLYVLKKKAKESVEDDDEEEEEEEEEDDDDLSRRGRQRQLVDIQINFNDSRRGRGRGRGARGIGPSTRGTAPSTRGSGQSTRSTGPSTRSIGPITRGTGPSTRAMGPRNERSTTGVKDVPHREERREPVAAAAPNVGGRSFRGRSVSGQQSAPKVDDWNDFPSLVTA